MSVELERQSPAGAMNGAQRFVILASATLVFAMMLFPPFHLQGHNGPRLNLGYAFVLDPPKVYSDVYGSIHVEVLLSQWIGLGVIARLLFVAFRDRTPSLPGWTKSRRLWRYMGIISISIVAAFLVYAGFSLWPPELEPPRWESAPIVESTEPAPVRSWDEVEKSASKKHAWESAPLVEPPPVSK